MPEKQNNQIVSLSPTGNGLPSIRRVVFRVVAIFAFSEMAVMLLIVNTWSREYLVEAFVDAILLSIIATPILYYWVIGPYVRAHNGAMNHVEFMAVHDPLTGLPNRRMLDEYLELVAAATFRHNYLAALFYFDLDGFKPINDDLGHKAGDRVLVELSKRLTEWTRKGDLICRVGGDEFVILISNIGPSLSEAKRTSYILGAKIRELTAQPIKCNGTEVSVGCSVGVCLIGEGHASSGNAVHEADVAMYQAKRARDGVLVFADEVEINRYGLLKTGIPQVDEDHAAIDSLIIHAWSVEGSRVDLVGEIVESIADHFNHEESLFSREDVAFHECHALAHRRLVAHFRTLANEIKENNVDETLMKIAKSLSTHFEQHDIKLSDIRCRQS